MNEEKTRICTVPEGDVRLPGLHVRTNVLGDDRQGATGVPAIEEEHPARVEKSDALTVRTSDWQETAELVDKMNRTLRGWANYFKVGTVTEPTGRVIPTPRARLRRWLRIKHKVRRRKGGTYPTLAFLRALRARTPDRAWA